jgi:hypothetical protein
MEALSNATGVEPELTLELRPGAPAAVRRARRWGRRAFWIGLLVIVARLAYPFAIHAVATYVLTTAGGQVKWESYGATAGSGTSLNTRRSPQRLKNHHLAWLPSLYHLRMVDLSRCGQITDDGIALLAPLAGLQELHLSRKKAGRWNQIDNDMLIGPRLTDRGLSRLSPLTQLQILSLDGTEITDAGLSTLQGMTSLEVLDLAGTKITDSGLKTLKSLKKLRFIRLDDTGVTCAGRDELTRALPDTSIALDKCETDKSNEKTLSNDR